MHIRYTSSKVPILSTEKENIKIESQEFEDSQDSQENISLKLISLSFPDSKLLL